MSETHEEAAEREAHALDHAEAAKLAREEPLQRAARAYLASVAASAIKSRGLATPHAVHLAASLLVDRAAYEAARDKRSRTPD